MKFNEKLMELRKKEGLSQEELGYKLNVTRQTVSKWELGQTTPEMDKLVEMSKIFNISVDELINESEITANENPVIEDQPIVDKVPKKNKVTIIISIALVIVIVFIITKLFTGFSNFTQKANGIMDGATESQQNIFERIFGIFDRVLDTQENMLDNMNSQQDMFDDMNLQQDIMNNIQNTNSEFDKKTFNSTLEIYNGSKNGSSLKKLFDEVITINKTEDRKITVKYKETETQEPEEIKDLKKGIEGTEDFEISFEYDENGYIYEVTIERTYSQMEIKQFNSSLELFAGSTRGGTVIGILDDVITNNKTNDRKITIKYKETETQDENEIKNIKRNFGTFDDCEITYEYDEDGFINKAIIEKL